MTCKNTRSVVRYVISVSAAITVLFLLSVFRDQYAIYGFFRTIFKMIAVDKVLRSICVVGLGNPGLQYIHTRHNIGWMIIDSLASQKGLVWQPVSELYHMCSYTHAGATVALVKPQTYMNLSGKAAKKALQRLGYKHNQVVVVVDEYNFPTGTVRLKLGGSDGGHNGITSMIQELQTENFWRMRCGIDRKFGPGQLVDYVLGNFPDTEQQHVQSMITTACKAIDDIARIGVTNVMQQLNTKNLEAT